nr:unnamed protein product [Callosobruchus analis]
MKLTASENLRINMKLEAYRRVLGCSNRVNTYNQHLNIHYEIKPFGCTECGKGFTEKSTWTVIF